MPPAAMAARVFPAIAVADSPAWRSRNSSTIDAGNFGAVPNPPQSASKSRSSFVTAAAGGVPDTQQDRHLALPRRLERLVAPLPPVDGVVLVLQQVRRGRARESVRHEGLLLSRAPVGGGCSTPCSRLCSRQPIVPVVLD